MFILNLKKKILLYVLKKRFFMELFCYAGYGGEFCIGKLTEEQTDFVFSMVKMRNMTWMAFGKIMKLWIINPGMILMKSLDTILLS